MAETDTGQASETTDETGSGSTASDYPKVEPAPEPDNPRFSTEHEAPQGDPIPLPGAE